MNRPPRLCRRGRFIVPSADSSARSRSQFPHSRKQLPTLIASHPWHKLKRTTRQEIVDRPAGDAAHHHLLFVCILAQGRIDHAPDANKRNCQNAHQARFKRSPFKPASSIRPHPYSALPCAALRKNARVRSSYSDPAPRSIRQRGLSALPPRCECQVAAITPSHLSR